FFLINFCFNSDLLISLLIILLLKLFEGKVKPFKGGFGKFNAQGAVFLLNLIIFLSFLCLVFQGFELIVNFKQQVFNTVEVGLSGIQFQLGFFFRVLYMVIPAACSSIFLLLLSLSLMISSTIPSSMMA